MDRDILRDDDALLAALKEALTTARHSQEQLIIANAQDAFTFPTLDEELIRLVYDSLLESGQANATRELGESRRVTFQSKALSMEVEIAGGMIFGQIAPGGERQVTVEAADGTSVQSTTDELGCFSARLLSDTPFRFRIAQHGSTTVTEWADQSPKG